jgi:hypothetical protein
MAGCRTILKRDTRLDDVDKDLLNRFDLPSEFSNYCRGAKYPFLART